MSDNENYITTRSTNRVLLSELCGISPTALVLGGSAFASRQQENEHKTPPKTTVVDFKVKTASALTDHSRADNEDSGNDGANNISNNKRILPMQHKPPARKYKRWYGSSDKKTPQVTSFIFRMSRICTMTWCKRLGMLSLGNPIAPMTEALMKILRAMQHRWMSRLPRMSSCHNKLPLCSPSLGWPSHGSYVCVCVLDLQ